MDNERKHRSYDPDSPLDRWLEKSRRPGPWLTASYFCIVLLITALTLLLPKHDYSEQENRKLASPPKFSLSAAADGKFAKDCETWFADHFHNRGMWISLQLKYRTLMGQRENGGVYIGKKNTLFLIPQEPDEDSLERNLKAMDDFAASAPDVKTYVAIVPNAFTVEPELLPAGAPLPDQRKQLAKIAAGVPHAEFLDVTDTLCSHKDEGMFYRTDHHWTSLGALRAFETMAPRLGIESPVKDYDTYTVSDSFYGTLASKSGKFSKPDAVDIYIPKSDVIYTVTYTDSAKKSASVYEREALKNKDKYEVFFGGNHPKIEINTSSDSGRHLLLIKDSYANSFVQFLYPYFEEIVIIDPRYYYDNASPLLIRHSITDVLYLYNCDTFLSDSSIADVVSKPQK